MAPHSRKADPMKLNTWAGALALAAAVSVAGVAAADQAKKPATPAKASDQPAKASAETSDASTVISG